MDLVKIGKFLSELRRENNLTQEQLGLELGVTNKTISRWENGNYLPNIEMLQLLSKKYNVSINEILSGEKLDNKSYKQKAEQNITEALSNSGFTIKEKMNYFKQKWRKDHLFEIIFELILLVTMLVLFAIYFKDLLAIVPVVYLIWAFVTNNRVNAYVEKHVFDNIKNNEDINKWFYNKKHLLVRCFFI